GSAPTRVSARATAGAGGCRTPPRRDRRRSRRRSRRPRWRRSRWTETVAPSGTTPGRRPAPERPPARQATTRTGTRRAARWSAACRRRRRARRATRPRRRRAAEHAGGQRQVDDGPGVAAVGLVAVLELAQAGLAPQAARPGRPRGRGEHVGPGRAVPATGPHRDRPGGVTRA